MNSIDSLTSPTLKDLREDWWNDEFTEFLAETLRPRPGNRILDVGCGPATGELSIGRLQVSQLRLFGIDLKLANVADAKRKTADHNQRASFAAADASRLPFKDGVFDSTFCVAVLQHIRRVELAVSELARVTRAGGRLVVVEPDNGARYAYSSTPAGARAFATAARFFSAISVARGDGAPPDVGPRLSTILAQSGIEPLDVRMFPVSHVQLGTPDDETWRRRRARVEELMQRFLDGRSVQLQPDQARIDEVQQLGSEYLDVLEAYRAEARQAGKAFVEIQNTMLFATVGQREEQREK